MKLFYSPASPYARKARAVILEKGLTVEKNLLNPLDDPADLIKVNPLGKVPCLVTDEGTALCDSPLICAYLDGLNDAPRLTPADGPSRLRMEARMALCDGILDAAVGLVIEGRKPEAQRSDLWKGRWTRAITQTLDVLEADQELRAGDLTLAQIGLGVMLGYLDFRLAALDWRTAHPALAAWFADFSQRPSMRATEPE